MRNMSLKHALLVDVAIATVIVAFVLIVAPGLAVIGMLALLVLVVGAASFVLELGQGRRRPRSALRQDRWSSGRTGRAWPPRGDR